GELPGGARLHPGRQRRHQERPLPAVGDQQKGRPEEVRPEARGPSPEARGPRRADEAGALRDGGDVHDVRPGPRRQGGRVDQRDDPAPAAGQLSRRADAPHPGQDRGLQPRALPGGSALDRRVAGAGAAARARRRDRRDDRGEPVRRGARQEVNASGHWKEYAMEGELLGLFMLAACTCATPLEHPASPVHRGLPDRNLRRLLMGAAMGLTAIGLIYSPWGQQSVLAAWQWTALWVYFIAPRSACWRRPRPASSGAGRTGCGAPS